MQLDRLHVRRLHVLNSPQIGPETGSDRLRPAQTGSDRHVMHLVLTGRVGQRRGDGRALEETSVSTSVHRARVWGRNTPSIARLCRVLGAVRDTFRTCVPFAPTYSCTYVPMFLPGRKGPCRGRRGPRGAWCSWRSATPGKCMRQPISQEGGQSVSRHASVSQSVATTKPGRVAHTTRLQRGSPPLFFCTIRGKTRYTHFLPRYKTLEQNDHT